MNTFAECEESSKYKSQTSLDKAPYAFALELRDAARPDWWMTDQLAAKFALSRNDAHRLVREAHCNGRHTFNLVNEKYEFTQLDHCLDCGMSRDRFASLTGRLPTLY